LSAENGRPENIVQTVTDISDRMTNLVRDEIELAKSEVTMKARSLLRGTVAVAAGAVFGVFAIFFGLETIAWALDAVFISGAGDIWLGFLIVTGGLTLMAFVAFMFAWRKLRVGPPTPTMAIDEARQIRETVAAGPES
jgi:Putative Actinobacterial Holin-X, holin superfamily III